MGHILLDLLVNLTEVLLVFMFLELLLSFDQLTWVKKIVMVIGWTLLAYGIDCLGVSDFLRSVLSISAGLMVIISMCRERLSKIIRFYLLSVILMLMVSELIVTLISSQLLGINLSAIKVYDAEYWTVLISCNIIAIFMYLLTRSYLSKNEKVTSDYFKGFKSIEYLIVLALIYIGVTFIISLQLSNAFLQEKVGSQMTWTVVLTVLAYILVFVKLLYDANKHLAIQHQWQMREMAYRQQLEHIKNYESIYEQIKATRHDFNHHLSCIYGLAEMCHYQELQLYIENLSSKDMQMKNYFECSDPYLSALLHCKYQEGSQKGIRMQFDIHLLVTLKIDPLDLSIIVGNAIDNAIEACEKLYGNRQIELQLSTVRNQFRLHIENSCPPIPVMMDTKQKITSKCDRENHGYGLQNIEYVVDKYDGILRIHVEKDIFCLQINMNNVILA